MKKVLFRTFLGLLGGLVAWAIVEPTNPGTQGNADWGAFEIHMVAALGICTGIAVGAYNAHLLGGRTRMILACVLGPILGLIGALMGYGVGGFLQVLIFHTPIERLVLPRDLVILYLSRIVALTPIGTLLGAAIGAASLDWRRIRHGAIGGTIGGAIGGMLFDPVAVLVGGFVLAARGAPPGVEQDVGVASRAVYFIVMAGCIALFIGIIEQIAKQASLFLAVGRNEGREFPLFGVRSAIGRNELAQVPLFHDPAIAPVHAFVDRRGPVYWIVDAGSGAPTFLNGQPVSSAPLDHGAQIQVGNTVLQFLLKALPRNIAPARAFTPVPAAQGYVAPIAHGAPAAPGAFMNPQAQQPMTPSYASQPTAVVSPIGSTLVATDGPLAGQRFALANPLEIGRESPGIGLRFDSSASRRHASISPGPSGLVVQDLGSTNGTFVNGQRVTSATIKAGDLVRIGATTFRVE